MFLVDIQMSNLIIFIVNEHFVQILEEKFAIYAIPLKFM